MHTSDEDRTTRHAFDSVAGDYARLLPDLAAEAPLDRAVLATFREMLGTAEAGPVADVGCGSGRIAAHLTDDGVCVIGIDLAPRMVDVARTVRPDIPFAVAHAAGLPCRAGSLAGLVAWYSLINLRSDRLPAVFAGFARALQPGAPVVVAFQSGDGQRVDRTTAYGHPVALTYYRHRVADVSQALVHAGFMINGTVTREPSQSHETTPQAFLLARRSPPSPAAR